MERGNTNSLLHEGLQEDEEKLNGVKAQMALPLGEGRSEGESGQGLPGSGATAPEGEGIELNGDSPSAAAAAADLADNSNQEDQGARGPGQESDKQPQEPAPKDLEGPEDVPHVPVLMSRLQPVSVLLRQCCFKYKLVPWQLQELERIFKQNHFLSALERKHLARWMGVTETLGSTPISRSNVSWDSAPMIGYLVTCATAPKGLKRNSSWFEELGFPNCWDSYADSAEAGCK
ncbi:rhox homeobox family member 1-like [Acomys russatus]|uniref:rhox homeobox family member 1-like n=1 Tax=Acomys russatus TaxID=60746 RepID=UPI0021E214AF|nr:rhox homeobox family member 1-like [Acomys russatus]